MYTHSLENLFNSKNVKISRSTNTTLKSYIAFSCLTAPAILSAISPNVRLFSNEHSHF